MPVGLPMTVETITKLASLYFGKKGVQNKINHTPLQYKTVYHF